MTYKQIQDDIQNLLVEDVSEHGQQEGQSLATPGPSDANQVAPRHDCRDGLGLDWSGFVKLVPVSRFERVKSIVIV